MKLNPFIISKLLVETITKGGNTVNFDAPDSYHAVSGQCWVVALGKDHEVRFNTMRAIRELETFKMKLEDVVKQVKELNKAYQEATESKAILYACGLWVDAVDLVIEPVQLVPDTQEALFLAIERDQSSIYHLGREEYVSLIHLKDKIKGGK